MTGQNFVASLAHMGYNDTEATRQLGLGSRNTLAKYRREGAPRYIALACAALAFGLPEWQRP